MSEFANRVAAELTPDQIIATLEHCFPASGDFEDERCNDCPLRFVQVDNRYLCSGDVIQAAVKLLKKQREELGIMTNNWKRATWLLCKQNGLEVNEEVDANGKDD